LEINDFPNLQIVDLKGKGNGGDLTKVNISECPNLEKVNLFNNIIGELNASNLINLKDLTVSENNLGKINVKGCRKLQSLSTFSKRVVSDKGVKEELEGLENLESLVRINVDFPFIPTKELKN